MAGNTVKVELVGVDKSMSSTFSKTAKNIDAVGRKMQSAGRAMTRNLTLPIVAIGAASVVAAEKVDQAYDKIRAGTGATGKKLEGLEKTFRNVAVKSTQGLDETAGAITDLNKRLGLTGKPLERMSQRFLELSRITGTDVAGNIRLGTRLFGDWSIKTGEQVHALDMLYRTTQQTGIGLQDLMETVVKFGAPLRNLGFSFNESIAMLGKWEREGVNVDTVLTGMRFALKTFASQGKDPLEAMGKAIDKIAKLPKMKALAVGKDTFGLRAFSDMVAAIREGRFQYDDLVKSVAHGKDTIKKAAQDTLSFSDKLAILKNKLTITGAELGEKLLPVIERVADAVASLADRFSRLSDSQQDWITKIGLAVAALGPLVNLMGGAVRGGVGIAKVLSKFGIIGGGAGAASGGASTAAGAAAGAVGAGGVAGVALAAAPLVAAAAGIAVIAMRNSQVQAEYARIAGQTGVRIDRGAKVQVGTGRGGGVNAGAYEQAIKAGREAATTAGWLIKLQSAAAAASGKGFAPLFKAIQAVKEGLVTFNLDVEHPLQSLQSMQARLMDLGMGAKGAYRVLKSVFGKDVVAPFRKYLVAAIPAMDKTKQAVIAKHREMANALMKKITMPKPNASGLLDTINSVISRLQTLGYTADQANQRVALALTHARNGGGHFALTDGSATGGITTGPMSGYRALLHGTEMVIPLNGNPYTPDRVVDYGGGSSVVPVVNVYLDSEPIAARVEVRQAKKARTRNRTLGLATT